jgi:hypothetical protein
VSYSKNDLIPDHEPIVRWIHPVHLYDDESVNPEAFRPTTADLNDGVSVELYSLLTDSAIKKHRFVRKNRSSAGYLLAKIPNDRGYSVKFTGKEHCVIDNDVAKLQTDEQALLHIAGKTKILFNPNVDSDLRDVK